MIDAMLEKQKLQQIMRELESGQRKDKASLPLLNTAVKEVPECYKKLAFFYKDQTAGGKVSRFSKLIKRENANKSKALGKQ